MCRALHLSAIALLLTGCPGSAKLPPDTGGGIDLNIIQLEDGGTKDTANDGPLDGPAHDGVAPKDTSADGPATVDTRVDGPPGDSTVDLAPCGGGCPTGQDCVNDSCQCIIGGSCNGCCQSNSCVFFSSQSMSTCGAGGSACTNCPSSRSDRCTSGVCRCGTSAPCGAGLNCVSGACKCIENGRCGGCCDNNTCYDAVTIERCGEDGSACFACPTDRASHCLNGSCSCHDGFGPAHPACAVGEICVPNGSGFFICELIQ